MKKMKKTIHPTNKKSATSSSPGLGSVPLLPLGAKSSRNTVSPAEGKQWTEGRGEQIFVYYSSSKMNTSYASPTDEFTASMWARLSNNTPLFTAIDTLYIFLGLLVLKSNHSHFSFGNSFTLELGYMYPLRLLFYFLFPLSFLSSIMYLFTYFFFFFLSIFFLILTIFFSFLYLIHRISHILLVYFSLLTALSVYLVIIIILFFLHA